MKQPIDTQVRKRFLALKEHDVLRDWLKQLKARQSQLDKTQYTILQEKNIARLASHGDLPVNVELTWKRGLVTALFHKIVRMQQELERGEEGTMTHLDLLKAVEPRLGELYASALSREEEGPMERWEFLFADHYTNGVSQMTTKAVMNARQTFPRSSVTDRIQPSNYVGVVSIDEMLCELRELRVSSAHDAVECLMKGDTSGFLRLPLVYKEWCTRELRFGVTTMTRTHIHTQKYTHPHASTHEHLVLLGG